MAWDEGGDGRQEVVGARRWPGSCESMCTNTIWFGFPLQAPPQLRVVPRPAQSISPRNLLAILSPSRHAHTQGVYVIKNTKIKIVILTRSPGKSPS